VAVVVTSPGSSVLLGNTLQFTAKVTGTSNTAVSWSVNGVSGGNSLVGTISNAGLYTAPQDLPNPATVTIQATSQANSTASGNVVLSIDSDISVSVAASPSAQDIPTPTSFGPSTVWRTGIRLWERSPSQVPVQRCIPLPTPHPIPTRSISPRFA
jgi:hypothetical protein